MRISMALLAINHEMAHSCLAQGRRRLQRLDQLSAVERHIEASLLHIANYSFDLLICAGGSGDIYCRTQFLGPPLPETEPLRYSLAILEKEGFRAGKRIFSGEYGFLDVSFKHLAAAIRELSANGDGFENIPNDRKDYKKCYANVDEFNEGFTQRLIDGLPQKASGDNYEHLSGRKKMWYFEVGRLDSASLGNLGSHTESVLQMSYLECRQIGANREGMRAHGEAPRRVLQ